MEPSKDCVKARLSRLNSQILNRSTSSKEKPNLLSRESLLDAIQLLYDECNSDVLKNGDKNILNFVDKFRRAIIELKQLRVNLTDFEIKNVIGRGYFGEVHVVRERQTGDVYAMKTVRKYDEQKNVAFEEERNIMATTESDWHTKLQYAFQDSSCLYFIMEYHPGGDLLGLLERQGGTIPESAASFYIAELVIAINDLHEMGFVHRDIKPDNILLDRCGHLKLADFGSAAKLNAKGVITSSGIPVGTPDYIAPEALQSLDTKTIKNNGNYGKSCDFWSLGILAYELTVGSTPFTAQNTTATYSNIMNYSRSLKFPSDILLTQAYISLVKSLLTDQKNRLNYSQIVNHVLFKNTDFNSLRDQVPPFVPKISAVDDTSNFSDLEIKKKQLIMENFKSKTQFSGRNLPFIGFTFTSEVPDFSVSYRSSFMLKDDSECLNSKLEILQKKLIRFEDISQERASMEKKLKEKIVKLESLESVRNCLERDLANNIAECQALKRTLELERKDRTDLERKALELIKSAKLKWEASEKIKLDNINHELEEFKERNNQLMEQIEALNEQLQNAHNISTKHKNSMENMEMLRRSSIVGLESRLEKVTLDSQNQLSSIQSKLNEEINKKKDLEKRIQELEGTNEDLEKKLRVSEKTCSELKSKYSESSGLIINLKSNIVKLEKRCNEIEKYEETVSKLEEEIRILKNDNELKKEIEGNIVLKKQIKDLKTELNSMRSSKLSSIEDVKSKSQEEIKDLQQQLKAVSTERNDLRVRNNELELNLKSKEEKANSLEELLNRLQSDLAKLQNGSERETVLQEQIERLENQIVELSESSALEKQEFMQFKSKFWRMEKDLTNAELDKRIVERDLKEEQKKCAELQLEITSLNEKMSDNKKVVKQALLELEKMNEKLHEDVGGLKNEIKNLEHKLQEQVSVEEKAKMQVENLLKDVQSKELKICQVVQSLNDVRNERNNFEKQVQDMTIQNKQLNDFLRHARKENADAHTNLEKCKKQLEDSHLNHNALREACTLLESQLVEFETLLDCTESKKQQQEAENQKLQEELTEYKKNIQTAKKMANEEKSLKLLSETKCKRLMDDLENLQKELDSYKIESNEFKTYSNNLSEELTISEQKVTDYEIAIKSYERQVESLMAETHYLKEENSEQLTFINNLKCSNYKLEQNLMKSKSHSETLLEKLNEINMVLLEKEQYYRDREIKFQCTIEQQTKLIDFLQSKVQDCNKKKKTLSDKIFGHSKKENIPLSLPLNYKDLELQLAKERELRKNLNEEIERLKMELYGKVQGTLKKDAINKLNIQDEMLKQIVNSPASQKNDLYRQNSVQRMHHNIPHRFETKICTKLTKCAQCTNNILLGRNISICKECYIVTHLNCASSLPSTCRLPSALAQHYTNSLSKVNKDSHKKMDINEQIDVEGWVKVPVGNTWEKQYAYLTKSSLSIYNEPPNNGSIQPLQMIELNSENESGKLILEPVASEIGIPVANSDLPFVIKVESNPNSTCWPTKCIIFMTLSIEDKDKWFKALQKVFHGKDKYSGELILDNIENLQCNCLVELKEAKIVGAESGLYSLQKNKAPLHIFGPTSVYEIIIIDYIKVALMIVGECRILISCDLNHLKSLTQYSEITKPTLKYKNITINNLNGFHIIKEANFEENMYVCVATPKQLVILKYDFHKKDFIPLRILDTAEPASCILFTGNGSIVGADKFFEVDLNTFEAIEFLDQSDSKLTHAVKCYKLKSFPLAILEITKMPQKEYLVCFNEFAIFVDENGRSTRNSDINWVHLPKAFHFHNRYLYVVQFNAVEIYKITPNTCNTEKTIQTFKIDMHSPQFIGSNNRGIYVASNQQIKFITAYALDDSLSVTTNNSEQPDEELNNSDRFSFTSSMVQSLDGHLTDEESEYSPDPIDMNKKVKFQTDL